VLFAKLLIFAIEEQQQQQKSADVSEADGHVTSNLQSQETVMDIVDFSLTIYFAVWIEHRTVTELMVNADAK
jgi:hypothetical protein